MSTLMIQQTLGRPIRTGDEKPELDQFVADFRCSSLLVECVS